MASLTHGAQVGRLEVVDTGRRRRWSEEEKLRIVAESFSGPRLVSSTARCHGISTSPLFAPHLSLRDVCGSLRDVCGGAAPPAVSQRDGDHVFEHKAIEFASIAFRKGLARSNEGCVP